MRVLLVKTSSMGDVIHTLPAVTDAYRHFPDIQFDWVVEEGFADLPALHPAVDQVFPFAIRRWRKAWFQSRQEISAAIRALREQSYDYVIDAQGLIKSAVLTRFARGPRYGLDQNCCREPAAARAYQFPIFVHRKQHAIQRVRQLFAAVFDYQIDEAVVDYGLSRDIESFPGLAPRPYVVFLHGTTWASKHWPESYWCQLAALAVEAGFQVYLPWGNTEEKERADRIATNNDQIEVLPKLNLQQMTAVLAHASGVIGVDSGLIHLAAALDVPGITLYGSTSAELTGTLGPRQRCLQAEFDCAPCLKKICAYSEPSPVAPACYTQIPPTQVWDAWLKQSQLDPVG